jgi:hypothetical protein
MPMTIRTIGALLAATAALVGCSSGGSGASPPANEAGAAISSVPSGTKLSALTPTQATQLCSDLDAYVEQASLDRACGQWGLDQAAALAAKTPASSDADLQAACTQGYNQCLSGDAGLTTGSPCDSSTVSQVPSSCTATVGQLETCTEDRQVASNQMVASRPSCASLTAATLKAALSPDAGTGRFTDPASCTPFDSNCAIN